VNKKVLLLTFVLFFISFHFASATTINETNDCIVAMNSLKNVTVVFTQVNQTNQTLHVTVVFTQVNQTNQTLHYSNLHVYSNPSNAQVYVDNVSRGITPLSVHNLSTGNHHVQILKSGYTPYSTTKYIYDGENYLNITLTPINQSGWGNLHIYSSPTNASIYLDGVHRGWTPSTIYNLSVGNHYAQITKQGYNSYSTTKYIYNGENYLNLTLTPINQTNQTIKNEKELFTIAGWISNLWGIITGKITSENNYEVIQSEEKSNINQTYYVLSVYKTGFGIVKSYDGKINCGNLCVANYTQGIPVTLTATPSQGYKFSRWYGCDSNINHNESSETYLN